MLSLSSVPLTNRAERWNRLPFLVAGKSTGQGGLCCDTNSTFDLCTWKHNNLKLWFTPHSSTFFLFFFFNLILFSGQNIKQCWVLAPWIGTGKVQWTKKLNFIFRFLRLRALQLHVWCCQLSWQQKNLRVCLCSWWGKGKERRKYRLILLLHKKSTKEIFPFLFHFYKVFSYWHMQCMHTKTPKPSKQKKSGLPF